MTDPAEEVPPSSASRSVRLETVCISVALGLENTLSDALPWLCAPFEVPGFPAPELRLLNEPLVKELGWCPGSFWMVGADLFGGKALPADARPVALAYAGHQFGHFTLLGDGRAYLLGERIDVHGQRRDLHIKGAGPTVFARGGDGRATLGPVLREYLVAEAMHALGVPTTRGLAALTTGDRVWRERALPGAALVRVGSSHLRVGTVELVAAQGSREQLHQLVDYAVERHAPERRDEGAAALLETVAERQASLVARWMALGFVHGVMNTDNVALSGETLDYGPCAFMDAYRPSTVFSSIDVAGRYAYKNQPSIARWNLERLADALLPLLGTSPIEARERAEAALDHFDGVYRRTWLDLMRAKLGLPDVEPDDPALVEGFLAWLRVEQADWTSTFRALAAALVGEPIPARGPLFRSWWDRWQARLGQADRAEVRRRMDAVNPAVIPRNHLVEEALDAALEGDMRSYEVLLERVVHPYEPRGKHDRYTEPAPADFGPYRTFCGT